MQILVENLGPIKSATIDLSKKLNVFCGGNGTGKTYMAYVLYAIASIQNKSLGVLFEGNSFENLLKDNKARIGLNIEAVSSFREEEFSKILPNLWQMFAISEAKSEDFFSKTKLQQLESKEEFAQRVEKIRFEETIRWQKYWFKIKKDDVSSLIVEINDKTIKDRDFVSFLKIGFLHALYTKLFYYPIASSAIFPVERNSIFTFNKELSIKNNQRYELIKQLSSDKKINPFDVLFSSSDRYPQAIKDCLAIADDLEQFKKIKSSFYDFAEEIEKELLGGAVVVGKEGSVEFASTSLSKKKALSFHQSSSIVKTLASLVMYLKHMAQPNDLVIIDEPELNLHPDNQIKLARIFARLLNNGLRLVISTHSDYILRELNNLIMLGSKSDELNDIKKQYHFKEDEYILVDEVDVHYFHYKLKTQASVKKLKISDYGFDVPSIDEAIEKQNQLTDDLYYTMKFGKQKNE